MSNKMSNLPEPVSRSDIYMAFLNGIGNLDNLPKPISLSDMYLYALCTQGVIPPVQDIEIKDGTLTLSKGNFYVEMQDGTEIILPAVEGYTEIRLWFKATTDLTLAFPNIAWQNEPESYGGCIYEYIFTYIPEFGTWVGGFVSYEVI